MYTNYGPAWELPLGVKSLNMPDWPLQFKANYDAWGWTEMLRSKLKPLVNATTGRIEAREVSAISNQPLQEKRMQLILAQLNHWMYFLSDGGLQIN